MALSNLANLNKEERYRRGIDHLVGARFNERKNQMQWMLAHSKKKIPGHSFSLKKEYYKLVDKSMIYGVPFQLIFDLETIAEKIFPRAVRKNYYFGINPIKKYYETRIKPWRQKVNQLNSENNLNIASFSKILEQMDLDDGRDLVLMYLDELENNSRKINQQIAENLQAMREIINQNKSKPFSSFRPQLEALESNELSGDLSEIDSNSSISSKQSTHIISNNENNNSDIVIDTGPDDLDLDDSELELDEEPFEAADLDMPDFDSMGLESLDDVSINEDQGDLDLAQTTTSSSSPEEIQIGIVTETQSDQTIEEPNSLDEMAYSSVDVIPDSPQAGSKIDSAGFDADPPNVTESGTFKDNRSPGGFDSGKAYDLQKPDANNPEDNKKTEGSIPDSAEQHDSFSGFVNDKLQELQSLEERINQEIVASEQKADQILKIPDTNEKVSAIALIINDPGFSSIREKLLQPLREEGSIFPKIIGHLSEMERKLTNPDLIEYVDQIIELYKNDIDVMDREPSLIQRLENYKANITDKPSELLKSVHTKLDAIRRTANDPLECIEQQIDFLTECLNDSVYKPVWNTIHTIASNILTQKIEPKVFEILDELILENRIPALQCFIAGFESNSVFHKKLSHILKENQIQITKEQIAKEKSAGLKELGQLIQSDTNWKESLPQNLISQQHPQIINEMIQEPAIRTALVVQPTKNITGADAQTIWNQIHDPALELSAHEIQDKLSNTITDLFQSDPNEALAFADKILLDSSCEEPERHTILAQLALNKKVKQAGQTYLFHNTIDSVADDKTKLELMQGFAKLLPEDILEQKRFQIQQQRELNQASSIFPELLQTSDPVRKAELFGQLNSNPLVPETLKQSIRKGAPDSTFDAAFESIVMSKNNNNNKLNLLVSLKQLGIQKKWMSPKREIKINNKIKWYKNLLLECDKMDPEKKGRQNFYTSRSTDIVPLLKRTKAPFSIVDQEKKHIREYRETQDRIRAISNLNPDEDSSLIENLKKDIPPLYKNKADQIIQKKHQQNQKEVDQLISTVAEDGLNEAVLQKLLDSPMQATRWYGRLDENGKHEFQNQAEDSQLATSLLNLIQRENEFKKQLRSLKPPIDEKLLSAALEKFPEEKFQIQLERFSDMLDVQRRKAQDKEERKIKKEQEKEERRIKKQKERELALQTKEETRIAKQRIKEQKKREKSELAEKIRMEKEIKNNEKTETWEEKNTTQNHQEIFLEQPESTLADDIPQKTSTNDIASDSPETNSAIKESNDIMQPLPDLDDSSFSFDDSLPQITEDIDMSASIAIPESNAKPEVASEHKKKKKKKSGGIFGSLFSSSPRKKPKKSKSIEKKSGKSGKTKSGTSARQKAKKNMQITQNAILSYAKGKPYISEQDKKDLFNELSDNHDTQKLLEDQSFLISVEHPDKELFVPPIFLSTAVLKEANRDRTKKAELIKYFEDFIKSNRSNKKVAQYNRAISFIEKYRLK